MTEKTPEYLYHYTTTENLLNILNTGDLWATNIEYLNDSSEFCHAMDLFKEVINSDNFYTDYVEKHGLVDIVQKLTESMGVFSSGDYFKGYFVVSFSSREDLLSQWRGYGDNGNGISIGFKFNDLVSIAKSNKGNNFSIEKCLYFKNQKIDKINKGIKEIITCLSSSNWNANLSSTINHFARRVAVFLKNYQFREEKEYRLVNLKPIDYLDSKIFFYPNSDKILVPRCKINLLLNNDANIIPISKIIIGPTANSQLSLKSIRHLLNSKNIRLHEKDITVSKIPYR